MKKKAIIITICVLLLLAASGYGAMKLQENMIYDKGEELFLAGDYVGASAEFEKIGRTDKMAECAYAYELSRFERAKELMEAGKLEEAKAEFALMGDFENAPELIVECDYRRAVKLREEEKYSLLPMMQRR